ncbi:MAG TPA: TonB-dependent receptor [Terriglobales bacterium]|nr:TonB-dependent receptor [Terriglobales bacterium]
MIAQGDSCRERAPWALALLLVPLALAAGETPSALLRLEGAIRDQNGAAVHGATVWLLAGSIQVRSQTGPDGKFSFDNLPVDHGVVRVSAPGFAAVDRVWTVAGAMPANLEVELQPAGPAETITVTATRTNTEVADTPASVGVLSGDILSSTAALMLDDTLRQVAGFTLFRRSGSRTANPTSQGVSLRGAGASGASRALVVADEIPLNDPFGSWVYWDRIPRTSLRSIEVLGGGASDLYGSAALGGVVDVLPRSTAGPTLALETSFGNEGTPDFSITGGGGLGNWYGSFSGEAFRTDGYVIVGQADRGTIDTPANLAFLNGILRVERRLSRNHSLFLQGSLFSESRDNGTPFQVNNTQVQQLVAGGDWALGGGQLGLRVYGGRQVFNQSFSAVSPDRNSEMPTRTQHVPTTPLGLSAQWSRSLGTHQVVLAGCQAQDIRGHSEEIGFVLGIPSSKAEAGGRQRTVAVFAEDIVHLNSRWQLDASLRFDSWRNFDGFSSAAPLDNPDQLIVKDFDDRTEAAFSPRLAVLFHASRNLGLNVSAYRSFRAPTLNELYRGFRSGNTLTLANANLWAERLTGTEAGAMYSAWNQRLFLRGGFFWSEIARPVANVTISTTPTLITRQRENLGSTKSLGVEVQADGNLAAHIMLSGGYQYVVPTVQDYPADPALVGLDIPQVPRHQVTVQFRYTPSRWVIALQGRASSQQFDDDQNLLPLAPYFNLDAFVSRSITRSLQMYLAVENVFDQRYEVARTPTPTLGPPVLARVGVRLNLGSR